MYTNETLRGFDGYRSELRLKATFLSIFAPCIVIFSGSRALQLSSTSSTIWYILGMTCGWVLFDRMPWIFNDYIVFHQWLPVLFPIALSLLGFQLLVSYKLFLISNHLNLYKLLRRKLNHISLIGTLLNDAAKKEYELEQIAKRNKNFNRRSRLKYCRMEQAEKDLSQNLVETFTHLCESEIDLREPVIIARKSNKQFVTVLPHSLIKNVREQDEILTPFLINLNLNETRDDSYNNKHDLYPKLIEKTLLTTVAHKNSGRVYAASKNCTNIDGTNCEGNTALMVAIQQGNSSATKILVNAGASILQRNNASLNAFDLSLNQNDEAVRNIIWNHIKKEKEHEVIFFQLCESGNIDGVKYCMDASDDDLKQSMIEFIHDAYETFPWYYVSKTGKNKNLSDYLFTQHVKFNPSFLKQNDKHGYDPMINASRDGHIEIVRKLLPIYRENQVVAGSKGDGLNSLMVASCNGHENIVQFLLPFYREDGRVEEKNILGKTALDYAKMYGHRKVVEILKTNSSN